MARPRKVTEAENPADDSVIYEKAKPALAFTKAEAEASLKEATAKSLNLKLRNEMTFPATYRNFKGKDFSNTRMADIFESKVIRHGDFTGANLDGADFQGFDLQGCIFTDATVDGANFAGCDLRWGNWKNCDYHGKAFFGTGDTAAEVKEVDGMSR